MSIIHQRDNARRSLPHEPIRKCSPPCDIALRRLGRLRLVYGLDAIENLAKIALCNLDIIVGLQIEPKLRRRAERFAKPKRSISGNASLFTGDPLDPCARQAASLGKSAS